MDNLYDLHSWRLHYREKALGAARRPSSDRHGWYDSSRNAEGKQDRVGVQRCGHA
jgi:hypothetical protein